MFLRERLQQAALAKKVVLDHFTYPLTVSPLGASATAQQTVNISADSDFLWEAVTGVVFTAVNNLDPAPDMTVQYQDAGSNRDLQSIAIHWMNCVGSANWPFFLPEEKLLIGNGGLLVTLTNLVAIIKNRVDMSFIGRKVFYIRGYNRQSVFAEYELY